MKNVLLLSSIMFIVFIAGCGSVASPSTPEVPATATLRLLATPSETPSMTIATAETEPLVPSEPSATPFVHVVLEGDTMLSIALRYGVGLEELFLVNPEIDPQFLSVGTSIRIPGPEGEAVDVLLPTPTPVSIQRSPVSCYEGLTGEFRCLSTVTNVLNVPVEAISGIIGLYDDQGNVIAQKSSDSTIQFVPSEQPVPLSVIFDKRPEGFAYGEIQITSAIRVDPEVSRFVPVEVAAQDWDPVDNGTGAFVQTKLIIPTETEGGKYTLRLLASAVSNSDEITGYRLIEQVLDLTLTKELQLNFYLISLGPQIENVNITAELIRVN